MYNREREFKFLLYSFQPKELIELPTKWIIRCTTQSFTLWENFALHGHSRTLGDAVMQLPSISFYFKRFYLFVFRERGREREREGEKHYVVASHAPPHWGPALQPRHVPWLGIEPVTLLFASWHSIHWATPARACLPFVTGTCLSSQPIHNLSIKAQGFSSSFSWSYKNPHITIGESWEWCSNVTLVGAMGLWVTCSSSLLICPLILLMLGVPDVVFSSFDRFLLSSLPVWLGMSDRTHLIMGNSNYLKENLEENGAIYSKCWMKKVT